jgi:hypothetical protein
MIRGMDASGRNLIPSNPRGAGSPDEKSLLASLQSEEEFWSRL